MFIDENNSVASQYSVAHSSPALTIPESYSALSLVESDFSPQNKSCGTLEISSDGAFTQSPDVEMPVHRAGPTSDLFYLDRYCHVIGPWFDLFDQQKHFSLVVPHAALESPLLYLSSLACASRQHHLTSANNVDTALSYYDDALQMLTAALRDEDTSSSTAVFASCLFLAHCEMIGASTQDWHLHLSGTYSLIRAHGWHGQCGGLGQACFW